MLHHVVKSTEFLHLSWVVFWMKKGHKAVKNERHIIVHTQHNMQLAYEC